MLKYVDILVTFREVPDEISLCINISNCPCQCSGCHSSYLAENIGTELTKQKLDEIIKNNPGISCVAFMGGDSDPNYINELARYLKENTNLKIAWYSGRQELSDYINVENFNFIKLGPYIEEFGPLDNKNTNQRFYKIENNNLVNMTDRFWK